MTKDILERIHRKRNHAMGLKHEAAMNGAHQAECCWNHTILAYEECIKLIEEELNGSQKDTEG